jgi:Coenzyme PQQ synthesis protein D (PqqD)
VLVEAPLSLNSIVVASPQQVSCALGEEAAILNTKNSVYYGMNDVGASVWALLKAPRRVSELRDEILREYDVDEERCERDVLALLESLRSEGLIEVRDGAAS